MQLVRAISVASLVFAVWCDSYAVLGRKLESLDSNGTGATLILTDWPVMLSSPPNVVLYVRCGVSNSYNAKWKPSLGTLHVR